MNEHCIICARKSIIRRVVKLKSCSSVQELLVTLAMNESQAIATIYLQRLSQALLKKSQSLAAKGLTNNPGI